MSAIARSAIALALMTGVAGCETARVVGNMFDFSEDDRREAVETAPTAQFAFEVESVAELDDFAESLAGHALRCWVRDDPSYRVAGPVENEGAAAISLIHLGDDPDEPLAVEGLRLDVVELEGALYAIQATGPLATTQFEAQIMRGVEIAAAPGDNRCA